MEKSTPLRATDLKAGDIILNEEGYHLLTEIKSIIKNDREYLRCYVISLDEAKRKRGECFRFPPTMLLYDKRLEDEDGNSPLKFFREGKPLK